MKIKKHHMPSSTNNCSIHNAAPDIHTIPVRTDCLLISSYKTISFLVLRFFLASLSSSSCCIFALNVSNADVIELDCALVDSEVDCTLCVEPLRSVYKMSDMLEQMNPNIIVIDYNHKPLGSPASGLRSISSKSGISGSSNCAVCASSIGLISATATFGATCA